NGQDTLLVSRINDTLPASAVVTVENSTHLLASMAVGRSTITVGLPAKNLIPVGSYTVCMEIRSRNGTPTKESDDIVERFDLTLVVRPVYGLSLLASETTGSTIPDSTISYVLDVQNTGSAHATYWINLTGARSEWASAYPAMPLVPAGAAAVITVNISVPRWPLIPEAIRNRSYFHIGARVTCWEDWSETDEVEFNTTIAPLYGLGIASPGSISVLPGQDANFDLGLVNEGTHADTYTATLSGIPEDWNAVIVVPPDAVVTLPYNRSGTIGIEVEVPDDMISAAVGTYAINVSVRSSGAGRVLGEATLVVHVMHDHRIELRTDIEDLEVDVGDAWVIEAEVKNLGNDAEDVPLALTGDAASWTVILDGNGTQVSSIALGRGSNGFIYLGVDVPGGASPGHHTLTLEAGEGSWDVHVAVNITVADIPDVALDEVQPLLTGSRGGNVTFTLTVENEGTGDDTFGLGVSGGIASWQNVGFFDTPASSPNRTIVSEVGPLAPGAVATVYLTVPIPSDADNGQHQFRVIATSRCDHGVSDWRDLTVAVNPEYRFSLEGDDHRSVSRGETAVFAITVTNGGNVDDIYSVSFIDGSPSGWTRSYPGTVMVGQGESEDMNISLASPPSALHGVHWFLFRFRSIESADVFADLNLTVEIDRTRGIVLSSPDETRTGQFGSALAFDLNVENGGNGAETARLFASAGVLAPYVTFAIGATSGVEQLDVTLSVPSSVAAVKVTVDIPDRIEAVTLFGNDTLTSSTFTVRARSTSDGTIAEAIDLTVTFADVFEFRIDNLTTTESIDPIDERTIDLAFRIVNTGTRDDGYSMDVDDAPDWMTIEVDHDDRPIAPGGSLVANVTVTLQQEDDIESGRFRITIVVTSSGDGSFELSALLILDVREFSLAFHLEGITTNGSFDPSITSSIDLSFRIVNDGTRNDSYTLDIVNNPLHGISTMSFDYTGGAIAGGESQMVVLKLDVPSDPADLRAGQYDLVVRGVSDGDNDMTMTISMSIEVLRFSDVAISSYPANRSVSAGTPAAFTVRIENRGNSNDTVVVTIDSQDPDHGWVYLQKGTSGGPGSIQLLGIEVDYDEMETVLAYVDLTAEEAIAEFDPSSPGLIAINVSAETSDGTPSNILHLTAAIEPEHRFELNVPVRRRTLVDPVDGGHSVTFTFEVVNVGTAPDTYRISFVKDEYLDVAVSGGPSGLVYGSLDVVLTVRSTASEPSKLQAGTYPLNVTVRSESEPEESSHFTLEVLVPAVALIGLEQIDEGRSMLPGENVTYVLRVANLGNADDTILLDVGDAQLALYSWFEYRSASGNHTSGPSALVDIASGEVETVEFHLDPPQDVAGAFAGTQVDSTIDAVSTVNSTARAHISISTTVQAIERSLVIDMPATAVSLMPVPERNTRDLTIIVQSDGNIAETVQVLVREANGNGSIPAGDLTWTRLISGSVSGEMIAIDHMEPGSDNRVTLSLRIDIPTDPSEAPAGDFAYVIEVRALDAPPDDVTARATKYVSLKVESVAAFNATPENEVEYLDPTGRSFGTTAEFACTVRNIGNVAETYTFSTVGVHSALTASFDGSDTAQLHLAPGESSSVGLTLTATDVIAAGRYGFSLRASSPLAGLEGLPMAVDVWAPSIEISRWDIRGEMTGDDRMMLLTVRVWNNGTAPAGDTRVDVHVDGVLVGNANLSRLEAGTYRDLGIEWTDRGSGRWRRVAVTTEGAYPAEVSASRDIEMIVASSGSSSSMSSGAWIIIVLVSLILLMLLIGLVIAGLVSRRRERPVDDVFGLEDSTFGYRWQDDPSAGDSGPDGKTGDAKEPAGAMHMEDIDALVPPPPPPKARKRRVARIEEGKGRTPPADGEAARPTKPEDDTTPWWLREDEGEEGD
ncbi:MAG: hypothetical protein L0Z54_06740, partial [Thermoplasmata archaeon]|nr:hypothetical protein [Thermoplasmata archaeon]